MAHRLSFKVLLSVALVLCLLLPPRPADAQWGGLGVPYEYQKLIEQGIEQAGKDIASISNKVWKTAKRACFAYYQCYLLVALVEGIIDSCNYELDVPAEEINGELQDYLDCLGLIPGAGALADASNIVYSIFIDDWAGAGWRIVFFIPGVGIGAAAVKMVVKRSVKGGVTATVRRAVDAAPVLPAPKVKVDGPAIRHTTTKSEAFDVKVPAGKPEQVKWEVRRDMKEQAGIPDNEFSKWTIDHVIPRQLSGRPAALRIANDTDNLRVLSAKANNLKAEIESVLVGYKRANPHAVLDYKVVFDSSAIKPKYLDVSFTLNGATSTYRIPNTIGSGFRPFSISTHIALGAATAETVRVITKVRSIVLSHAGDDDAPPPDVPSISAYKVPVPGRAGYYWIYGVGHNWEPDTQFYVACTGPKGTYANTLTGQGAPNGFLDRYSSDSGTIVWHAGVCRTPHPTNIIEVWNDLGQFAGTTV